MNEFPHSYSVKVEGGPEANLTASVENLASIEVAPPLQFGGPGDQWSPEDLFVAAVANCFVLSFRAVAKASKVNWTSISCVSEGTLDRQDRKIRFTNILTKAKLTIPPEQDSEAAAKALDKAEHSCLVTNSLSCESQLEFEIIEAASSTV